MMDAVTRMRLAQVARFTHDGALEQFIDGLISARDAEWTRAIGYDVSTLVLSPEEARSWLEKDRVTRARNVSDARVRRGPVRW
jgi:hypothetical protein